MGMTHHMDKLETALSLLDEARGFAAMSPGGRDNIIAVEELLPEITELAYRSGFEDGEKHAAEHAEIEHKRNSSFVPVHKAGTFVPSVTALEIEAASKAIYEHKPYLNHSGKSHMAWSVYKRELSDEYERLKVAVRIGLEAASRAALGTETPDA